MLHDVIYNMRKREVILSNIKLAFSTKYFFVFNYEKRGRDLTQSYDKNPYNYRNVTRAKETTQKATKNFDYTAVRDRLRTVSWSNYSHPYGVVKRFTGSIINYYSNFILR